MAEYEKEIKKVSKGLVLVREKIRESVTNNTALHAARRPLPMQLQGQIDQFSKIAVTFQPIV